jgi:hypothetical protein
MRGDYFWIIGTFFTFLAAPDTLAHWGLLSRTVTTLDESHDLRRPSAASRGVPKYFPPLPMFFSTLR